MDTGCNIETAQRISNNNSISLSYKGYGETMFIAPNENEDGSDNPEGRQMNRRTEFRIVGSLDQYSKVIYEE